ncbi:MAG: hypothetical protein FJ224_01515 [Lentisphaerae bacterium]|nr:hypothetical protein [Lentisphaerota bacterium]
MRALRFLAGMVMLPACATVSLVLADLLRTSAETGPWWQDPFLAMASGFALWLVSFLALPKPARAYILAHELTHALWGGLMGARVSNIRVSEKGGSVMLSKTNIWITLAPYFFPLYTAIVIAAYCIAAAFVPMARYAPAWLALVGFTWGFHFTFTLSSLLRRQSDIQRYGYLFSYTVIYLLNAAGLCLWVVAVTPARKADLLDSARTRSAQTARAVRSGWKWGAARLGDFRRAQSAGNQNKTPHADVE